MVAKITPPSFLRLLFLKLGAILKNSRLEVFYKKSSLKNSQNLQQNTCIDVSFSEPPTCNFIEKKKFREAWNLI